MDALVPPSMRVITGGDVAREIERDRPGCVRVARDPDRAAIFAPFGLGVLDLAVGKWVHDRAVAAGAGLPVPDFFSSAV